jgi:hypothetical protein
MSMCRVRNRLVPILSSFLLAVAVVGCDRQEHACARALERYESLRADALGRDPVLSQQPQLAAEHLRQTRGFFTEPVRARCVANPAVARCIAVSASFNDAQRCL